jgi:hypothetical protein
LRARVVSPIIGARYKRQLPAATTGPPVPTGVAPLAPRSANLAGMQKSSFAKSCQLVLALTLSSPWCCAQAQDARADALQAAVADGVSGAALLVTSAVPFNPLLPIMAVGMKAATLEYTSRLPEHERPAAYGAAKAMWAGGAVNNVCMTASLLSGGGFIPACIALGVAWGVQSWKAGERERLSHTNCAALREFMYDPEGACSAVAGAQETAADRAYPVVTAQDLTAP